MKYLISRILVYRGARAPDLIEYMLIVGLIAAIAGANIPVHQPECGTSPRFTFARTTC
jgi:hypothetical protein